MNKHIRIKTTISYKHLSRVEYWELATGTFYEYKVSFKQHFLSTNFSTVTNDSKNKISKLIDKTTTFKDIQDIFKGSPIDIIIADITSYSTNSIDKLL